MRGRTRSGVAVTAAVPLAFSKGSVQPGRLLGAAQPTWGALLGFAQLLKGSCFNLQVCLLSL